MAEINKIQEHFLRTIEDRDVTKSLTEKYNENMFFINWMTGKYPPDNTEEVL